MQCLKALLGNLLSFFSPGGRTLSAEICYNNLLLFKFLLVLWEKPVLKMISDQKLIFSIIQRFGAFGTLLWPMWKNWPQEGYTKRCKDLPKYLQFLREGRISLFGHVSSKYVQSPKKWLAPASVLLWLQTIFSAPVGTSASP